jgi:hypothetical protein
MDTKNKEVIKLTQEQMEKIKGGFGGSGGGIFLDSVQLPPEQGNP